MFAPFTSSHRGGSGSPLLCLHGFTGTWRVWELVLPALEREHDVLALTLPGHAGGPPIADDVTTDQILDAVERMMDEAGFATALVAHQMCGTASCAGVGTMIEIALREGYNLNAQRVTCPVRIVWGTGDKLLAWPSTAARFREHWLPHADWVELDGVGHCPSSTYRSKPHSSYSASPHAAVGFRRPDRARRDWVRYRVASRRRSTRGRVGALTGASSLSGVTPGITELPGPVHREP